MNGVSENPNLLGYGSEGSGAGWDLKRSERYHLKMAANIARGDKKGDTVPDADARGAGAVPEEPKASPEHRVRSAIIGICHPFPS